MRERFTQIIARHTNKIPWKCRTKILLYGTTNGTVANMNGINPRGFNR